MHQQKNLTNHLETMIQENINLLPFHVLTTVTVCEIGKIARDGQRKHTNIYPMKLIQC